MVVSTRPDVTILMSVLNGSGNYLDATVESILRQSYDNFEFIIVDDGSVDATYEILTRYSLKDSRIKLIKSDANRGIVRSLNAGLERASSKIIARIDCGDVADSQRIELQYGFLKAHSDYVLVSSQVEWISMKGEKLFTTGYLSPDLEIRKRLFVKDCILFQPAVMFRFTRMLYYRDLGEANNAEDYDYWLRLSMLGKMYIINKPLVKVRANPDGTTYSRKIEQVKSVDLIHRSFICTLKGKQDGCELPAIRLSGIEMCQQGLFHKMTRHAASWSGRSRAVYCFFKWMSVLVSPYYLFTLLRLRVMRLAVPFSPLFKKYISCVQGGGLARAERSEGHR